MILIDYVSEQCYWFSHSDSQLAAALQPNINDSIDLESFIELLTQR